MNASTTPTASRWPALGGVVFVVLTIVAVVILDGNTPSPGNSADSIRSFYADNKGREIISAYVTAASVPFFLFYAATLANAAAGAGRRSIWQLTLLCGSGMIAVSWAAVAFLHFALTDGVGQKASDGALEALTMLDGDNWILFNTSIGVFMLGAAGALLGCRTRAGHRQLGWVALVLGIALFIPFADFFALLLSGLWIVVTSVVLARRRPDLAIAMQPERAAQPAPSS